VLKELAEASVKCQVDKEYEMPSYLKNWMEIEYTSRVKRVAGHQLVGVEGRGGCQAFPGKPLRHPSEYLLVKVLSYRTPLSPLNPGQ
jgi:hypothetical protein